MDHYLHHSDGDDLDKLIKNFELENQNCVRLIQKESQHIEALEKEIREGKSIITDLQEKTSQLDEDIKQGHRQYTYNRDNCESLKKTLVVLKEHDEALDRQLTALEESSQQDRNGRLEILQHYTDVWENYQGKYKMFPLALSLEEKQKDVSSLEKRLQNMESQIKHLHTQMNEINESTEDELKDLNKFIVSLAAVKLSTESMSCQIKQMVEARGQIQEQIRQEKEAKQVLAMVNAREDISSPGASLMKSSPQDHVQPHVNQDQIEPQENEGHIQPHGSPESVQVCGSQENAQPHLSPDPVQPCASPEYIQPCLSTDQAQPHPNPESVQPCMDIQESDGDGSSLLINMFSEKQDDVDTERDMETNMKSSLQPTICHPLMALPQNLSSSKSCAQTLPHQSQQRQAYQGQRQPQQGQHQPQPLQQLQQQQVQRQQLQVHQQQRQSQQVQQHHQVQEQLQQEQQQVQRQQLQVHQQRQSQQVQQHHQVQEQLQQEQQQQQVQRQQLQVHQQQRQSQQVQQHHQVQEQPQQEQQQQVQGQSLPVAQPTASGLNHISAPSLDQMSVPRAAGIKMPSIKTSNYNQIFSPRAPSISQMPAPKTPNISRISVPAAPSVNLMQAQRTPNLNQISAPRTPTINQISALRTPNFNQISALRAPSINQMAAPKTPYLNQMSAPRSPSINLLQSSKTPNLNQIPAPRAPSISPMSAHRSINQIPAPRVSSTSQMSAPRTPNLGKISMPRAPSVGQMSAPKTPNFDQMQISPRAPTQNQIILLQKESNNVSTSSSSLSGQAAVCSPQQTKTRQTDTLPKTPPSSAMGHDAMDLSPFDFEKHQQKLKLLSKSPGPMSYSTRTMFSENQNDPQDNVGSFLHPFIGEASNLFGERNTRGFETGQAMNLFGNDKPTNLFGNEGTTSTGLGNHSASGGESLMSLFGGGDQTSSNLGSQEQETSFSFNFGTDKGGDSLMSLFGGGSDNSNQGSNTKETSFSMNFGGGSDTTDSPRGFSLF